MLTRKVDDYRASGSTGGHLGLQWAWNLISEDWASFWGGDSRPDPYAKTQGDKPELIKAVILMTDGVFNTSFFNGNSASAGERRCARGIKDAADKNVLVFSIAFGDPPAQAKRTLAGMRDTAAANTMPMPRSAARARCSALPSSPAS